MKNLSMNTSATNLQVLTKCSRVGFLIPVSQMTSSTQRRYLNTYFVNTSPHPLAHRQARLKWYKRFVLLWGFSPFRLECLSWRDIFSYCGNSNKFIKHVEKMHFLNLLTYKVVFNQLIRLFDSKHGGQFPVNGFKMIAFDISLFATVFKTKRGLPISLNT